MRQCDVLIIGGGLAGLTAALTAASEGVRVTLLAKGAGTLAFGGGTIDVLGYAGCRPVRNPIEGLAMLPPGHPYVLAGPARVAGGLDFLRTVCAEHGYPLAGSLNANMLVPTVAGTLKPSCLVPRSMAAADMTAADVITLVVFPGLKEYYPSLVLKGLQDLSLCQNKQFSMAMVESRLEKGRDMTSLDLAWRLDGETGRTELLERLKRAVTPGSYLLMPPVLGTEPVYDVWEMLERETGCRIVEMAAPPPAVSGNRLRRLLLRALKNKGVTIVEQAHVRRAICSNGRCIAVATRHYGREMLYEADRFIIATGGFLGGGLTATPQGYGESIFGFPVSVPGPAAAPGGGLLGPHGIFRAGLTVDDWLRPLGADGTIVYDNVHAAGNILAGYDYSVEKSGNGVAAVTGWLAAKAAVGRDLA